MLENALCISKSWQRAGEHTVLLPFVERVREGSRARVRSLLLRDVLLSIEIQWSLGRSLSFSNSRRHGRFFPDSQLEWSRATRRPRFRGQNYFLDFRPSGQIGSEICNGV